jgi:DNA-binding CsgD family transcriptional regulator
MRVLWEQKGILLPIYRLAGKGFSDADIASKLNITELNVRNCMTWLLRFLKLNQRSQLIEYASTRALGLSLSRQIIPELELPNVESCP